MGTLERLPAQAARKVGMTSNHHGLYAQGYTRATMVVQRVAKPRGGANPRNPASQFGLESATRLHEGGIASNRASAMAR
jgi:hypothetical protein